jgi:membrane-associated phospholipid phosphatase
VRAAAAAAPPAHWRAEAWRRMRRLWWLKTLGICAFMWLFFIAYFHLLRHPAFPVTTMPLTALDRAIPFTPEALGLYVSLWVYVGVPPGLMWAFRDLLRYGAWAAALCLAGLACFYFWPTAVPPQPLGVDLAQHPAFALLQGVDAAGNACPSLHVATAVFTAAWIERQLRGIGAPAWLRLLSLAWLLLIAWSTLAVKQHVALDALAGAVLGGLFAAVSMRGAPRG